MAYQCDRCLHWTANNNKHECINDEVEKLRAENIKFRIVLEEIASPNPNPGNWSDIALLDHWADLAQAALRGDK
jgi:hypothetical protein